MKNYYLHSIKIQNLKHHNDLNESRIERINTD